MNPNFEEQEEAYDKRTAKERLLISKLSRQELEDRYFESYDANILLKKHARKQEEKIKKLATRLIRLVNDKKRTGAVPQLNLQTPKKVGRDLETEEFIADLQRRLAELETQNKRLRESAQVTKIQMASLQKKGNAAMYGGVSARIDTGLPKRPLTTNTNNNNSSRNIRSISTNYTHAAPPLNAQQQQDYYRVCHERDQLDEALQELRNHVTVYEHQIESLQSQLRENELNFDEDMLKLKNQVSQDQKQSLQENIDQIRLQRELKDKANQYTELYAKFNAISQQYTQLKDNHHQLLQEIEGYNVAIKREQRRTLELQTELKNAKQNQREILELKERIEDLARDNDVLKQSNEKLLNSAFSLEREREFREREKALKIQIAQLEATLKSDIGEKGSILDKLTIERDNYDKLNTEFRDMQVKYYEMKQRFDDMNDKVNFLSQEGNVDFREIEEALLILKERKASHGREKTGFLADFEGSKDKNYQKIVANLEAQIAETARELDKSRRLLVAQVKINEDYKSEVKLLQIKMEDNQRDYEKRLSDMANMLDQRADKIKKLEKQMKDIAYGTKQVRIAPETQPIVDTLIESVKQSDAQRVANLERGQNIFEISILRIVLNDEAMKVVAEKNPATFCTVEFYEHELQTSAIVHGAKPEFNFASQYVIKVDDFFLHYLQREKASVELHQSYGADYRTLAACQLSFRELIDSSQPSVHGTARLISVEDGSVGVNFGTLEFSARLVVPVEQAFRLYKERNKALGYISSNSKAESAKIVAEPTRSQQSRDSMNDLTVTVMRCSNISGKDKKAQPAAYCVYKFYDFKDHDTEIIAASNYPEFHDVKSFAVHMDMDIDRYLKKEQLKIFVFDDNQPEDDPEYLGCAKIDLVSLSHDKDIKGTFELRRSNGTPNGTIDVSLAWKCAYLPPSASSFSVKDKSGTDGAKKTKSARLNTNEAPVVIQSSIFGKPSSKNSSPRSVASEVVSEGRNDPANSTIKKESEANNGNFNDTYFADEHQTTSQMSIRNEYERNIENNRESMETVSNLVPEKATNYATSNDYDEGEDDDDVVVTPGTSYGGGGGAEESDKVVITIANFSLSADCAAMMRDDIQQLFVGMEFLDYDPKDLETPYSLQKPRANSLAVYNFKKEFYVDARSNLESRQRLAQVLGGQNEQIKFALISEPASDNADCEDVGYCSVDIYDLFASKRDLRNEKLPLFDANDPSVEIGFMTVSVEIVEALSAIENEMTATSME